MRIVPLNSPIYQNPSLQRIADYEKQLDDMKKAWVAGSNVDPSAMTGTEVGRPESLDPQFVSLTHEMDDCRFFQDCPKDKVPQPVIQYARRIDLAQLVAYGESGDVDNLSDRFDRKFDLIKYFGVKGEVSGVADETEFIVDAMTEEENNKMKTVSRGINLVSYWGDSLINTFEFDSLYNQVLRRSRKPAQQIYDLRGEKLGFQDLIKANTIITKNYGGRSGRKFYSSLEAMDSMVETELENKTYFVNARSEFDVKRSIDDAFASGSRSMGAKGTFEQDIFLSAPDVARPVDGSPILNQAGTAFSSNHPKAPSQPANVQPVVVPTTTAYSIPSGTYNYAVVAFNRFGQSLARTYTVLVAGNGNMVTFPGLAESAAVAGQEAVGYMVYRRDGASNEITDYKYVRKFGLVANTWIDDNEWIPGCSYAILFDWTKEVIRYAQLMPVYKLPYGVRKDAYEFLIKIYIALQSRNTEKIVVIRNIGTTPKTKK